MIFFLLIWKQAVKELKTKCDKHISSLNGSSVYAKRMTKTDMIILLQLFSPRILSTDL